MVSSITFIIKKNRKSGDWYFPAPRNCESCPHILLVWVLALPECQLQERQAPKSSLQFHWLQCGTFPLKVQQE